MAFFMVVAVYMTNTKNIIVYVYYLKSLEIPECSYHKY